MHRAEFLSRASSEHSYSDTCNENIGRVDNRRHPDLDRGTERHCVRGVNMQNHGFLGGRVRVLRYLTHKLGIARQHTAYKLDTLHRVIRKRVHALNQVMRIKLYLHLVPRQYRLSRAHKLHPQHSLLAHLGQGINHSHRLGDGQRVHLVVGDLLVSAVLELVVATHRSDQEVVEIGGFVH